MVTRVINPLVARHTIRSGARVGGALKRTPSRSTMVLVKAAPKRRRRNPLIMPNGMTANPLIMPNGGRRRRRRRNPSFSLEGLAMNALAAGVTGGAAFYANKMLISNLGTDSTGADTANGYLMRSAVRLVAGGLGSFFLPTSWGQAWFGAMAYPIWREIDAKFSGTPATATSADLNGFEAELNDVLDGLQ